MNHAPPPPAASRTGSVLLVLAGVLFIAVWILAHVVWASMSFMASLMSNDSGAASSGMHLWLLGGMLGGQLLTTAAGIPCGLAFFWRDRRRRLLWLFGALFVAGALLQVLAFSSFFSSASGG